MQNRWVAVCMRIADVQPANVVEGTVARSCNECGQSCWLSPATSEEIGKDGRIICVVCYQALGLKLGDALIGAGSLKEAANHIRRQRLHERRN